MTKIHLCLCQVVLAMSKDKIGVITHIDGTEIQSIERRHREEWVVQLQKKLEDLEGIKETVVDQASNSYNSVVIAVVVSGDKVYKKYELDANLRSLSQRMMHIIRDDRYAGANIVEPQILSKPEKDGNLYDGQMYRIEVSYP